jgi:hypothetical protein
VVPGTEFGPETHCECAKGPRDGGVEVSVLPLALLAELGEFHLEAFGQSHIELFEVFDCRQSEFHGSLRLKFQVEIISAATSRALKLAVESSLLCEFALRLHFALSFKPAGEAFDFVLESAFQWLGHSVSFSAGR